MDGWEITLSMSRELMEEWEKMSASVADERVLVGKFVVLLKENSVLRAWRNPLTSIYHGLGCVPLSSANQ